MLLYALRFVISKLSVDAFSLLYSKLLHAKLSLFVFGAHFAESLWQVISIFSCFIRDYYLSVVRLEWIVSETQNILIAVGRRFKSYA